VFHVRGKRRNSRKDAKAQRKKRIVTKKAKIARRTRNTQLLDVPLIRVMINARQGMIG
jgi:hypothetical protein